jgi:alpha-tubulin suppressor-like RCC1 family protein
MSTVDKTALLAKLKSLLEKNYSAGSSKVGDVLASALSTKVLGETNIITVPNIELLPNLVYFDSPSGMLYYVDDIDVFALSSNYKWLTLDGRLLRLDTDLYKIFSWGQNTYGQLGDGTTIDKYSPSAVLDNFFDWCQVSAGESNSLGVRVNGTAWAWGRNLDGRLGNNSTTDRSSPVSVVGGFADWIQVSSGTAFSLGLRANGTAWAWGGNSFGRLGDGTTTNRSSPVSVVGGFADWIQVSAGDSHSLGVRQNGTAWGWGSNSLGRIGDGTNTSRSSPVSVIGGFTDWCQLSAGASHSLGVRTNGTAWAWGWNPDGRLGDNTITTRSSPVSVIGGFTDWCQVSARGSSAAIRSNGTAWAWGSNTYGIGDGTTANRSSPVSVIGGFIDWCQISLGNGHTLGVRQDGTAWAWGDNRCGQLGDGTKINRSSPVNILSGSANWCQVSAGSSSNSFAIRSCVI